MKKTTFLIVGKHAVLEALKNPSRKIERIFLTEESNQMSYLRAFQANFLVTLGKVELRARDARSRKREQN